MWEVSIVVHGDDFTSLGTGEGLNLYEQHMSSSFDCKLKGRLGEDKDDLQEVRILNRMLQVTKGGLIYEADPRHAELLARDLGFALDSNGAPTPGIKPQFAEDDTSPVVPR